MRLIRDMKYVFVNLFNKLLKFVVSEYLLLVVSSMWPLLNLDCTRVHPLDFIKFFFISFEFSFDLSKLLLRIGRFLDMMNLLLT